MELLGFSYRRSIQIQTVSKWASEKNCVNIWTYKNLCVSVQHRYKWTCVRRFRFSCISSLIRTHICSIVVEGAAAAIVFIVIVQIVFFVNGRWYDGLLIRGHEVERSMRNVCCLHYRINLKPKLRYEFIWIRWNKSEYFKIASPDCWRH